MAQNIGMPKKGVKKMKKQDLKMLVRLMLTPALMLLLGIVLVSRPDSASALIAKLLGWVLVLLGAGVLFSAFTVRQGLTGKVLFSLLCLAAGAWILRNPLRLAAAIGRVAGLLILVRAVQDMISAAQWKCGMTYALIAAAVGVLLIVLPMTTSRLVMTICGLVLLFLAVMMGLDRYRAFRHMDRGPDIIDAL